MSSSRPDTIGSISLRAAGDAAGRGAAARAVGSGYSGRLVAWWIGAGGGVDGGQHEMPGFGGIQSQAHGLRLAHLAYHQHIGVLAQGVEEGLLEGRGVPADFALTNVGHSWAEGVFNRALDRDDVPG